MTTPSTAYRVMRKVWPYVPRAVRRRVGRQRIHPAPWGKVEPDGLLGDVDLGRVVHRLECDGLVVFDQLAPPDVVAALVDLARRPVPDPDALVRPRHDLAEADLLGDPTAQRLAVDPSFRRIAAAYLGGEAVNDLTAMWWSAARPGGPSAEAAQRFHTDRDRLSFLKFFLYLTDVDDAHGPHVYVKGTHRHLPPALRADRRFSDAEVTEVVGADALVPITGPAGTLFAADTSGLHKGLAPSVGHRLVFQVEFSTSLFGAPYESFPAAWLDPETRAVAEARPHAYRRLLEA